MPITIICPTCQRKGNLPDTFRGGKIKCPSCQTISEVPAPSAAPAPTPRPAPRPAATAPRPDAAPLPRLTPRSKPAPSRGGTGPSPLVYGLIAAGGVITVLLVVGLFLVMGGSGGNRERPAPEVKPEVAANPPTSEPATPEPEPAAVDAQGPLSTPAPISPAVASRETAAPPDVGSSGDRPASRPSYGRPETQAETIRRIKEATVFIKVRTSEGSGSGSGFVVRTDGNTALIATNHHVISAGADSDEPNPSAPAPDVSVVFRSGTGPTTEVSAPATIVATDRVGQRDLAILRVRGVANLPKPIDLEKKADPIETMPVLIYGFPFGEMERMLGGGAAAGGGNPAITINKGSVSSLKRIGGREVSYVQIDGSLNPGNSGGPVVDEQGRLVGVAVAQIRNTTIGFAVPAPELTRMLDGRVGKVSLSLTALQGGMADVAVRARLIDPQSRIRGVRLSYAKATSIPNPPPANPDGTWPALAGTVSLDLRMETQTVGGLTLPLALGQFQTYVNAPTDRRLLIQVSHTDASGRQVYAAPEPYEIPEKPGEAATPGGPTEGDVILTADKLGPVSNSKDCKATRDGQGITINVPGTLHILSPELKVKNAPMMLGDVEGDFVARVRIPGDLRPGVEPVRKMPITFHGAGLLIWQDANNFLRLERTAGTASRGPQLVHRILVEACNNGKAIPPAYIDVPEAPWYLQLVRLNGGLHCMFSPDGKQWLLLKNLAVEFPEKTHIGISAANTSKKPFAARFEEFLVVKPKGKAQGTDRP